MYDVPSISSIVLSTGRRLRPRRSECPWWGSWRSVSVLGVLTPLR